MAGEIDIVLVGGGAGGFELSVAAAYRLRNDMHNNNECGAHLSVTLIASEQLSANPQSPCAAFGLSSTGTERRHTDQA